MNLKSKISPPEESDLLLLSCFRIAVDVFFLSFCSSSICTVRIQSMCTFMNRVRAKKNRDYLWIIPFCIIISLLSIYFLLNISLLLILRNFLCIPLTLCFYLLLMLFSLLLLLRCALFCINGTNIFMFIVCIDFNVHIFWNEKR